MMDRIEYARWLTSLYRPLMGADDDPDPDPDPDPKPDDDPNPDPDPKPDDDPDPKPDDDPDPDPSDDAVAQLKTELDKNKRELAAAQAAIRKAKQEAREARSKAASESGNWEEVAKTTKAELEDANERAQKAEERAAVAETNLDAFQRKVRVTSIASQLDFRDPADAIALLSDDDTGDEKTAERALRKLAEKKPYLVDQRRASGRAMGGGRNGGDTFTREQLEQMSQSEIIANQEKVDRSLRAMQPRHVT